MSVYGYVRVSTAEQAGEDKNSLEAQRRRILRSAEDNGFKVSRIFSDAGVSGSIPLSKRPEGGVLVGCLVRGDTLIVSKLDRAFRSASDALNCADIFRLEGVSLIISDISSYAVTDSGPSKLFFGMMALVAEFERSCISERMLEGRRGKRSRGGHIGGFAPYGFRVEGRGSGAYLIEVPREAEMRRVALGLREEGYSLRGISDRLALSGYFSRMGKPLCVEGVRKLIGEV